MSSPSHADLLREYLEQLTEVDPETQVLGWRDWLRARVSGPVAITAALSLFACGGEDEDPVAAGGTAGATQAQGGSQGLGGTTARGGSSAFETARGGTPGMLYAAPMGGSGSIGALYAIAMGGSDNAGGTSSASGSGGTTASTVTGTGGNGAKYAVPIGGTTAKASTTAAGSSITRYAAPIPRNR
jgi:hypothetical protein